MQSPGLVGRCTLTMDGTGVGAPVLEMLRRARLGCRTEAVIMTGGEAQRYGHGGCHVPKRDLVTGLQLMLEHGDLGLSTKVPASDELAKELSAMRARINRTGQASYGAWREGEHDDLAMATALACWKARWKPRRPGGRIV